VTHIKAEEAQPALGLALPLLYGRESVDTALTAP